MFQPGWKRCLLAGPPPPSDALTSPPTSNLPRSIQDPKKKTAGCHSWPVKWHLMPFSFFTAFTDVLAVFCSHPPGIPKKVRQIVFLVDFEFCFVSQDPVFTHKNDSNRCICKWGFLRPPKMWEISMYREKINFWCMFWPSFH